MRAAAVSQKLAALRRGKAMRRAPICAGRMRLPKPDCGASGEDEEEHQRAVHGDQGEILFGEDGAVEGSGQCGPGEVDAHQEREERADDYGVKREVRYWMPMMRWSVEKRKVCGYDRA
jgi:hypothetical protein